MLIGLPFLLAIKHWITHGDFILKNDVIVFSTGPLLIFTFDCYWDRRNHLSAIRVPEHSPGRGIVVVVGLPEGSFSTAMAQRWA